MPLLLIFGPLVSWLIRAVVIKFIVLTAVFSVMAIVIPMIINLISPFLGVAGLTNSFVNLDPGIWFFLDFFALDYGVPLILSAFVTRFLIRRLPVIG